MCVTNFMEDGFITHVWFYVVMFSTLIFIIDTGTLNNLEADNFSASLIIEKMIGGYLSET